MGAACGTDCQVQKLIIDMDSKASRNRLNSKQCILKPKHINMDKKLQSIVASPLPSPPPSPSSMQSMADISSDSPKTPLPLQSRYGESDINDHKDYESDASIQAPDDEDLYQSSLILTQLYENENDNDSSQIIQTVDGPDPSSSFSVKPNLFRPDTTTAWDVSDIDDLEDEMKQELQSMVLSHTQNSINSINIINDRDIDDNDLYHKTVSLFVNHHITNTIETTFDKELSIESGYHADNGYMDNNERGSNLIQTLSHDWDSEDMDIEENQMKKHLNHLKLKNENSNQS